MGRGVNAKWIEFGAVSLLCLGLGAPTAWAVDGNALARLLVKKGLITESELQSLEQELAKEQQIQEERVAEIARKESDVPEWVKRTTWKGDIRLRNEYRDREGTGGDGNRQRVRFRYGFTNDVNDQLQIGARLATGTNTDSSSPDPVSTNQTMDDTFARKNFNLDWAYVRYAPEVPIEQLRFWGGFFANPFLGSEMLWDGDLSFAGAAVQAKQAFGPIEMFVNTGIFPIDSDGFPNEWVGLYGAQGGLALRPFEGADLEALDDLKVTSALGYFDYKNAVKAKTAPINTQGGNTAAVEDFNGINLYTEVGTKVAGVPVALWTDYVHNTSAPNENDGVAIGIKLGKAEKPWHLTEGWEAGYYFERLEADAAFDGFVDSDFGGGGTNHKGNVFYAKLAVLKNSTIGIEYDIAEEVAGAKDVEDRVQMDWETKF